MDADISNNCVLDEELVALKAIYDECISSSRCTKDASCVVVMYCNEEKCLKVVFQINEATYPQVVPVVEVFFKSVKNEQFLMKLKESMTEEAASPMLFTLISEAIQLGELQLNQDVEAEKQGVEKSIQDEEEGVNCQARKNEVQCKFFLQGKCRFGDRCFNLHSNVNNKSRAGKQQQTESKGVKLAKQAKNIVADNSVGVEKKQSMKTATDVIHRILWDDALPTEMFVVGYLDRFIGIIEKPFNAFSWEDLASVDYNVLAIPKHRIQYFKFCDQKVWDKGDRMDKMFGSTGDKETIFEIMSKSVKPAPTGDKDNETKSHDERNRAKLYDERNRPNHFLCIRVTDPSIKKQIEKVQAHILETDDRLEAVVHDTNNLHVTLCMFRIETDEDRCKALSVLKDLEALLPCIVPLNSFQLSFRYVDHFRQRVIYAGVCCSPELIKLADMAQVMLKNAGVHLCGNYDPFNPHMTFVKLTRPFTNETRIEKIETYTFEAMKDTLFGQQKVHSLRMCETGPQRGEDGFYVTLGKVENNLLCISPKLIELISDHVKSLMRSGILDECDADEILEGILSNDKIRFEKATLVMEKCLRGNQHKNDRYLFVVRGLPGSGKTFLCEKLKRKEKTSTLCSADSYFENQNKSYKFSAKEITSAHEHCRNKCVNSMADATEMIFIDNTHSQRWEYCLYERLAVLCGYQYFVVEITCDSESSRQLFLHRCLHNVTDHVHKTMKARWQSDPQAILCSPSQFDYIDFDWIQERPRDQTILYSALYLDEWSRDLLLQSYPAMFKNIYADHMTIMYYPTQKHLQTLPIGKPFRVRVDGYYGRAGMQIVSVRHIDDVILPQFSPHVTISTSKNIPPKDATDVLNSCACALPVNEIILSGVVGVQVATGVKTSVKCCDGKYVTSNFLMSQQTERLTTHAHGAERVDDETNNKEIHEASLYTGSHTVKRLCIFDFDGTLFHSPDPVKGREQYQKTTGEVWPHRGWLSRNESLEHPLHVYPAPSLSQYWDHIDRACSYTVLCTGRLERVRRGVTGILKEADLSFDRVILKPDDDQRFSMKKVVAYKKDVVSRLLREFKDVNEVKFWDDRIDNITGIKEIGRKHPSIKFHVHHITESKAPSIYTLTTYELFQRMGTRPSPTYEAAVRAGMEIIRTAWLNVLHVKEFDGRIIYPFGSYLLERRGDVDICIMAPKHNDVDSYLSQLADMLKSYGIQYMHCVVGIRCPRLKVKFVYDNAASLCFDIVLACVLDNVRTSDVSLEDLRNNCDEAKSKVALEGLLFHQNIIKPACIRLCEAEYGMVVEALVTILKRRHLKGNAFHCIRTFHVVQLLANYLSRDDSCVVGADGFENVKDFEKFLQQVLCFLTSLSVDYLRKVFKGFVPDCYITPLLSCFAEVSKLNLEDMLFTAPRLRVNECEIVTLTIEGRCPIAVWKIMQILEARVGSFIRKIIDSGFTVLPREIATSYLSFGVLADESINNVLEHFVKIFENEIRSYDVCLKYHLHNST